MPPAGKSGPSEPVCLDRRRSERVSRFEGDEKGDKAEKPWTAPDFIAAGDGARDRALTDENQTLLSTRPIASQMFSVWTTELRDATDCYDRALRLYPTSYAAHLGLGMVYLVAVLRAIQAHVSIQPYLPLAKDHLGRAYLVRTDQTDPLLYLALTAVLEGQTTQAEYILKYLQKVQPKNAEVITLAGYAAERSGNGRMATQLFTAAYGMGASANTLAYLAARLSSNNQQP